MAGGELGQGKNIIMETGSPWSTPTESELGAAEAALLKNNKELYEEIDFKVGRASHILIEERKLVIFFYFD